VTGTRARPARDTTFVKPAVLYLSYDGILEPLGESQVVSYLERLAGDYAITLMSFEKPGDAADGARVAQMASRLAARQIEWVRMPYRKRPPVLSTAIDAIAGIVRGRQVARERRVQIVHARSYVPALIALGVRGASGAAFLFDTRGFWVDEKVEAGHWARRGLLYRIGKWWERRFFAAADAVVLLTGAGARALPELGVSVPAGVPVKVIPTCADLQRFSPGPKDAELAARLGIAGAPVIGCVGTMGNWYMRDEMIDCLAVFARSWPELRILIVTRDDHRALKVDLERVGIRSARLAIASTGFDEMPRYIRLFDAGLFFIKPSFSKRASAATKLAEFLGCGVPVLINDGVGDSGTIVRDGGAGVVLAALNARTYDAALAKIRTVIADPETGIRCRRVATEVFDLDAGVERYRRVYGQLLNRSQSAGTAGTY
jgi:glycosyltransferase involved in cell wall biosynthesis